MINFIYFIIFVLIVLILYNIPLLSPMESFSNHKYFSSNYNQLSPSGKLPYAKLSYPIYDMKRCLNENPQGCKTYDSLIYANCKDGYKEVYGYSCFPNDYYP